MKKMFIGGRDTNEKIFIGGRGTNEKYQIFEKILEE